MSILVSDTRPLTASLLAMLRAEVDDNDNLLSFGNGQAPNPPTGQVAPNMPYGVVWPPTSTLSGPFLGASHADGKHVFQIDSVGANPDMAQWMQTRTRNAVLGDDTHGVYRKSIIVAGQRVIRRELDFGGNAMPEGALWVAHDRFALWLTPA